MGKMLVLDGNSIANRAFYGIRLLSNKKGLFTNAIYGFLNILFKYLDTERPDYVCVAFDMAKPTFRHLKFEGYKAQRKGMPEELAVQMPVLRELLDALGIPMLSMEGYEADDVIGTIASMCNKRDTDCIIATGDRDSLQLVGGRVKVYLTSTKGGVPVTEVYDEAAVEEKYGIRPPQLVDVKGLMGDPSDNIPGVAGIGEKTALLLVGQYGSIDGIYANLQQLKGSVRQKLESGRETAFECRELARIDTNVPIDIDLEALKPRPHNEAELKRHFEELEFKSFLKRLELEAHGEEQPQNAPEGDICILEGADAVKEEVERAASAGESAYTLHIENGTVAGAAFTAQPGRACYTTEISSLKVYFEDPGIKKTGHNIKDDILALRSAGIALNGAVFDTALAAYIIEPSRANYDVERLASEVLGVSVRAADGPQLACRRALAIERLKAFYENRLETLGQHKLFYEVELPLTFALADMQYIGFKVDRERLKEFSAVLEGRLNDSERAIYDIAGCSFNINSPKQLGEVLFDTLGLPVVRKTKTGYSTDAEVLEKLADKHPIIDMIRDYRMMSKLKSTYSDGLLQVINPETGKIHSRFNQTVTVTGRISSTEPNLQNIPVRHELGREIRKMFIASGPEYCLLDADYSQIELRVLAHISGDEAMIDAFRTGKDIHAITASQVFGVPLEEVSPLMRSRAKAVNFGIVYGIGDYALSQDLKITRREARAYIDSYFRRYSGVRRYMDEIIQKAQEQGYVTTILNRRRYIPELKSQKSSERSFGQRVALNTPIQGSAADIIKLAMVRVYNALKEGHFRSRLILQVHDELIVEAHVDEADEAAALLKREMENAYDLCVPLVADVNRGQSWYDAK